MAMCETIRHGKQCNNTASFAFVARFRVNETGEEYSETHTLCRQDAIDTFSFNGKREVREQFEGEGYTILTEKLITL